MKRIRAVAIFAALLACGAARAQEEEQPKLRWKALDKDETARGLYRLDAKTPLLVVSTAPNERPYIHPIHAPDGKGVLTEYAPGHHKHQTGVYFGFLKVNGQDYFHNRGKTHFGKGLGRAIPFGVRGSEGFWVHRYSLLGNDGEAQGYVAESGHVYDRGDHVLLDLWWTAKAEKELTFGKHDYGGLFVRMPWRKEKGGKAVNSEGDEGGKAEGKKAKWVDVGVPVEGREEKDWGHIAILDHPDNRPHPTPWRVDGQLGVGPAPGREKEWKTAELKPVTFRYRLVIYTGEFDRKKVEKAWKEFGEKK